MDIEIKIIDKENEINILEQYNPYSKEKQKVKYYPFKNIYPKHWYFSNIQDKDNKIFNEASLFCAALTLQYERVLDLIDNVDLVNYIHEYKFEQCTTRKNVLEALFIDSLYSYEHNKEKYLKIIELIASKYPKLITDLVFELCHNKGRDEDIIEILKKYYIDNNGNNNISCYVCLESYSLTMMLQNICLCNSHVHIECIQSLLSNKKCKVCNSQYKTKDDRYFFDNKNIDSTLYFPFDDIYPNILSQKRLLTKFKGVHRFEMAIIFLQVNRLKNLLENCDGKELLKLYNDFNYYGLYEFLDRGLPSHYSLEYNKEAYEEIKYLFRKYKFIADIKNIKKQL